jgi:hypothetical protein
MIPVRGNTWEGMQVITVLGARHTNTESRAVQNRRAGANGCANRPLLTNDMAFSSASERVSFEDNLDSGLKPQKGSRILHNNDFQKLLV